MRRLALVLGVILVTATAGPRAYAADAAPPAPAAASSVAPPQPALAPSGIAVLAAPGATDAAWPLAMAVYGSPTLRPPTLDEPRARVLCGEPPPAGAPPAVRDLAETVAAVRGDDAPSRALLVDIAHRTGARALLIVSADGGRSAARLFLAESGTFDAAVYGPDDASGKTWNGTTQSLARSFVGGGGPPPPPISAPPLATHDEVLVTTAPPKSKAFYEKGWFWGAVGAAAFAGGAIFFATRDSGPTSIHLTVQVPH